MKEAKEKKNPEISVSITISTWGAFAVYVITGLFLIFGFHVVRNKYSVDLISDPTLTLRLLWVLKLSFITWLLVDIFQLILAFLFWCWYSDYWVPDRGNHLQLVPTKPREMLGEYSSSLRFSVRIKETEFLVLTRLLCACLISLLWNWQNKLVSSLYTLNAQKNRFFSYSIILVLCVLTLYSWFSHWFPVL